LFLIVQVSNAHVYRTVQNRNYQSNKNKILWALDRLEYNSRLPLDRLLHFFDPVTLIFDLIFVGGEIS